MIKIKLLEKDKLSLDICAVRSKKERLEYLFA